MEYKRFEDLPVWQAAIELGVKTFSLMSTGCIRSYGDLQNQIERAVISVSNNIAEGFERGTHEELLAFLFYAKGSVGEVRSMLHLIERLIESPNGRTGLDELRTITMSVSRQLGAWIESLKSSRNEGPRYENASTKRIRQGVKRQDQFLTELRRIVDESRTVPPVPDKPPEPPE